jgi:hypothetical protein
VTSRVWLPEGRWTDFFTGDVYQGGWQDMTRPLDSFPLLAKEGGILVLDGAPDGNSTALPSMLDAHIFSGSGSYELIEDEDGSRAVTRFVSLQESDGLQTLTITADDPGRILPRRGLTLRLRNMLDAHVTVLLNGRETDAYVRQESGYTLVRIADLHGECRITATEQASAAAKRQAVISRIVTALEADYDLKEELWSKLCACASAAEVRALIAETALPESRQARLCEIARCFEG